MTFAYVPIGLSLLCAGLAAVQARRAAVDAKRQRIVGYRAGYEDASRNAIALIKQSRPFDVIRVVGQIELSRRTIADAKGGHDGTHYD